MRNQRLIYYVLENKTFGFEDLFYTHCTFTTAKSKGIKKDRILFFFCVTGDKRWRECLIGRVMSFDQRMGGGGEEAENPLMLTVGSILTPRVIDIFPRLHTKKPLPGVTFASAGCGWLC